MDKATTAELIDFILESLRLIKRRLNGIQSSDNFLENDEGLDKLDAISMRLQSIGEALKNLDKREKELLLNVADKEYWSKIIRTREILTHHYIDIDAETIYMICNEKLAELEQKILKLQEYVK
ncbi:DUF86 domain-containing protein [Sulfuricurvum sp.]|uniref:HepT-like ribonuclease domain-containing protein n=1 Tax=Sulfuricurvum sp. TaxID=2025608 RepID=UPI003C4FDC6D